MVVEPAGEGQLMARRLCHNLLWSSASVARRMVIELIAARLKVKGIYIMLLELQIRSRYQWYN